MRGKSYLTWEAAPILLGFLTFAFLASNNWSYESRLLFPRLTDRGVTTYIGPILLAVAVLNLIVSGGLLALIRITGSLTGNAVLQRILREILFLGVVCLTVTAFYIIGFGPFDVLIYCEKQMPF